MDKSDSFKINDLFHTFQGEGYLAGHRALFVRMPYCNLKCTWCDTKFNSFFEINEKEFDQYISKEKCRFAVITGGEPMMNKQTPALIKFLSERGFYIACETNGNFPIIDGIDFVTCSPKRFSSEFRVSKESHNDKVQFHEAYYVHPETFPKVHEFKYVVDDKFDFGILKRHEGAAAMTRLSLSPEFGNMEKSLERIYEFIKEHPNWKLNLQTHKFIGIP